MAIEFEIKTADIVPFLYKVSINSVDPNLVLILVCRLDEMSS